mgnify:CR=1 FL=1
MSGFVWTEAMSVGVAALDADHRCLVRIINLLNDAQGNDTGRVIGIVMDTLAAYARFHFAREEQVMSACGFPALAVHSLEHEEFCRTIAAMAKEGVGPAAAADLLEYLKGWLLHHILIQDMAYRPYIADSSDFSALSSAVSSALPPIDLDRLAAPRS